MKKADLVDEVVEATHLRKRDVVAIVEAALAVITAALREHQKVQLVGFGVFEPRPRRARTGRNPRTQEEIEVADTWSLVFRPSRQLRTAVAGRDRRAPRRRTR